MGNKLSCCCLKPNASPKLGQHAGGRPREYETPVYGGGSRNSVAEPPATAAMELDNLHSLFCDGHPILRLSDVEKPDGKEVAGVHCSQKYLCPVLTPGSPSREPPPQAPCLEAAFLELALPGVPTPYSLPVLSGQFPCSLPKPPSSYSQPSLRHSRPWPFLFMPLFNVSWASVKTFGYIFSFLSVKT